MSTSTTHTKFRRVSAHIIEVRSRRISEFKNTMELIVSMRDAVVAHRRYYEAGILHRNVSEANICILAGKNENGDNVSMGVLLDLDLSDCYKRFIQEPGEEHTVQEIASDEMDVD